MLNGNAVSSESSDGLAASSASTRARSRLQAEEGSSAPVTREVLESRMSETLSTMQTTMDTVAQANARTIGSGMENIQGLMATMQAELVQQSQKLCAEAVAKCRAESDANYHELSARVDASDMRVSTLATNVSANEQALEEREQAHIELAGRVAAIEKELVMFRSATPSYVPGADDWNREEDLTILRARCPKDFTLDALKLAIAPLIARAKVQESDFEIRGPQLGKAFVIAFKGVPELAARTVGRVAAAQRGEDGTWQKFTVELPSPAGQAPAREPLFIDVDKNRRRILVEKSTKLLRDMCAEFSDDRFYHRRQDGVVFANGVPLAEVSSSGPAQVHIRWNPTNPVSADLRQRGLAQRLRDKVADPISRVQWV